MSIIRLAIIDRVIVDRLMMDRAIADRVIIDQVIIDRVILNCSSRTNSLCLFVLAPPARKPWNYDRTASRDLIQCWRVVTRLDTSSLFLIDSSS